MVEHSHIEIDGKEKSGGEEVLVLCSGLMVFRISVMGVT